MAERWLVTGGLGFIGSELVRRASDAGIPTTTVDLDTYAGDRRRVSGYENAVRLEQLDVSDSAFTNLVVELRPDVLVHLAAETHVTRGETDAARFYRSNVEGTKRVMEAGALAGCRLVVHVSTDEVYGPYAGRPFKEEDKEPGEGRATSAYARSKALADDIATSAASGCPVIVVRPTNCFGPWQHPEKAIPRWTTRALRDETLPVWGDGLYVRDWMHVEDACDALALVVEKGAPGEVYNIAPEHDPLPNIDIARSIASAAGRGDDAVFLTAYDRPDHDRRYSINATKLRSLGWEPGAALPARLEQTVSWYARHRDWWEPLLEDAESLYDDARPRSATSQQGRLRGET